MKNSNESLLELFDENEVLELGGCSRNRDRDKDRDRDRDGLGFPSVQIFEDDEILL